MRTGAAASAEPDSRHPVPEVVLRGCRLWTGAGETPVYGPGAVAIGGGRILAVGGDSDADRWGGSGTRMVHLGGRFLMPGFVDAHLHLLPGGLQLGGVELRGTATPAEFTRRVGERAASIPPGEWILGGGWNERDWDGPLPAREWVDPMTPGHPVLLHRTDLHLAVANTRALELAGICDNPSPTEPEGVERDPSTGRPTGLLREGAILHVRQYVPPPGREVRERAILAAARYALSRGVTQLHDMGVLQDVEGSRDSVDILARLEANGRLPIRVLAALPIEDRDEAAERLRRYGRGPGKLRQGVVKGFVDGSLGASTAWFHHPYTDDPTNPGGPVCDLDELAEAIAEAAGVGLDVAVHAIGDRANDWLLRVYGEVRARRTDGGMGRGGGVRRPILRIEHAQHLTEDGVREAARGGAVLSMQPAHLRDDGPWMAERIGGERCRWAYPFASLHEGGAGLAFGSDWPVAPPDPLLALAMAMEVCWRPGQGIGVEAALAAHTLGGAVAGGWEGETGTMVPGKAADLVVLSRDPREVPPEALLEEVGVELTMVAGECVFVQDGVDHPFPVAPVSS